MSANYFQRTATIVDIPRITASSERTAHSPFCDSSRDQAGKWTGQAQSVTTSRGRRSRLATADKKLAHLKGVGGKVLQSSFDQARENALREAIAPAAVRPRPPAT